MLYKKGRRRRSDRYTISKRKTYRKETGDIDTKRQRQGDKKRNEDRQKGQGKR